MGRKDDTLLALDIGKKRVGLAIASGVGIARPLITLQNTKTIFSDIQRIINDNNVAAVIAGYPRGLDGQYTEQTRYVDDFVAELKQVTDLPITLQDEALTSVKAKQELASRKQPYAKGEVDSLAATYILDDYIDDNIRGSHD